MPTQLAPPSVKQSRDAVMYGGSLPGPRVIIAFAILLTTLAIVFTQDGSSDYVAHAVLSEFSSSMPLP